MGSLANLTKFFSDYVYDESIRQEIMLRAHKIAVDGYFLCLQHVFKIFGPHLDIAHQFISDLQRDKKHKNIENKVFKKILDLYACSTFEKPQRINLRRKTN